MLRKKDIAYLVIAVAASALISFFISNRVFGTTERSTSVETVAPIVSDFTLPSDKYFNQNAINPTRDVTIGDDPNADPFKSAAPTQ